MHHSIAPIALIAPLAVLLTACAGPSPAGRAGFVQDGLPAAVQVPAGHKVAMETVGVGRITYECKARPDGQLAWAFVGPEARLDNRQGQAVGRYYGPPATWESTDGSWVSGTQIAVAPAAPGNIPLQLVKADPANGRGAMTGVTFVQRVATRGGVAPAKPCNTASQGAVEVVPYQADYILWKAA